ncbi:MAG: hypothetical protein A2140_09020 [Candidatus Muproteobacteria bacterium RBG_16_62_13]|uniref:Thioredoxin-like fold domain-containing protein n=1 Tax=Candidatus Muproteobacteria bacterium RBG_16_62_13 TaxID=1817756 RepID=A0A1F6T3J3_9PROT|nr:MAG: hypothetical protein A2140_09020 [Candidatus Muproteobacteria bacterium RBG_16_62_13]
MFLLFPAGVFAGDIPLADDLQRDAARDRAVPVLLFFVSEGCPYCAIVEKDYLRPMHNSREFTRQVIIRKIDIGESRKMKDFQGRELSHREFARRARTSFTPTLRLYGAGGADLVEPIIGYNTPQLYGGRITRAIDDAREHLLRGDARGQRPDKQPLL